MNLQQVNENQFEYIQPSKQQHQYKIFINHCNGYIGSQLVQTFRNDHLIEVNPNIICGTYDLSVKTQGDFQVNHVIDQSNRILYTSVIRDCDIIVYVLQQNSYQEFEYLLKLIGQMQLNTSKTLICISSLLSWAGRRIQLLNGGHVKDEDYLIRNSHQSYLQDLQNKCLGLKNTNPMMNTYLIAAGLVYGLGQNHLFRYFKQALEQNQQLKVYGSGSNHIPMVHLIDLCNFTSQVAFTKPNQTFYFCVDNTTITQKELIQTISTTLGNGKYECIPIQQNFLQDNFDLMTVDLIVDSPCILKEGWHCGQGFIKNIGKIVSEFNVYRGLKPNKVIILGVPGGGKTKVCQIINKMYGIPIISVNEVIQQVKKEEGQFGNKIRQLLDQIKGQKVQQQKKLFEEAKKKKKGKGPPEQFNPDKVIPRLGDEQLIQIYQRRLNRSDCLNKGYILDGWPKSYAQAEKLFNLDNKINHTIFPNSVFVLHATQEEVKERLKKLPQQQVLGTHWTDQHTTRRYQTYNQINSQKNIKEYFKGKIDIQDIPFNYEGVQLFTKFIERNGPLGFKKQQKKENKIENIPEDGELKQPEKQLQNSNQLRKQEEQQFDIDKLKQNQKKILNQKSRPIRQYLIDNVIPQITEGLLQICRTNPQQPIPFLIKFLEAKQDKKKSK